jgi:hypothetical protein|tara:strand:- start:237 stop:425 length:189 start_codon:yes stop_codon:yes gene_type:complete
MAIDTASNDIIKKLIHRRKERLTQTLVRDVDNINDLHYIRGQIKSLEDLQQDIIDLLKKQEQ